MKRSLWIPCNEEHDPKQKMLWAASRIGAKLRTEKCPYCDHEELRFYYHFWEGENPKKRGTFWVWCPACHYWTHISGFQLDEKHEYQALITELEIVTHEKKHRLLDMFDMWWDSQKK